MERLSSCVLGSIRSCQYQPVLLIYLLLILPWLETARALEIVVNPASHQLGPPPRQDDRIRRLASGAVKVSSLAAAAALLAADYEQHDLAMAFSFNNNSTAGQQSSLQQQQQQQQQRRMAGSRHPSRILPHRTVYLAHGEHILTEPLVLDRRHSHTTWLPLDQVVVVDSSDKEQPETRRRRVVIRGGYSFRPASFSRCRPATCRHHNTTTKPIWVASIPPKIHLGQTLQTRPSRSIGDCAHGEAPDVYWMTTTTRRRTTRDPNRSNNNNAEDLSSSSIPLTLARHPNLATPPTMTPDTTMSSSSSRRMHQWQFPQSANADDDVKKQSHHHQVWPWFHVQNTTDATQSNTFERDANDTIPLSFNRFNRTGENGDLWLHGYWTFDYTENYVRVHSMTSKGGRRHHGKKKKAKGRRRRIVRIDNQTTPFWYKRVVPGARYRWINALELLDAPGEYYIDRRNRLLYVMAPDDMASINNKHNDDHHSHFPSHVDIRISTIANLVHAKNLQDTTFRDIHWGISRGTALRFQNPTNVTVEGGSIVDVGGDWAIDMTNASECTVRRVLVEQLSCGGINIQGGSPRHLISSKSAIRGCHIRNFGLWKRTYTYGISSIDSVGLVAAHNIISNGPHIGMRLQANDCLVENNTFYDLCTEAGDAGAFYSGRSWAERNNTLRHNTFHRIRLRDKVSIGFPHVQAIYLDDQMSGFTIENTTIIDSDVGILIGGGRRNRILNTTFVRVDQPFNMDRRGTYANNSNLIQGLKAVHFRKPPWSRVHREVANMLEDRPGAPVYTVISNVTFCHEFANNTRWFVSPDTNLADFMVWDGEVSNIRQDMILC